MQTLFISDLHLDPDRPRITGLFLDFLRRHAIHAEQVYVLGDLFEVWIGDDDETPFNREIIDSLRTLVDAGVPVYLMHGNRDFLLGEQFETASGCRLIPDPTVIELYGEPTLLMHGDTLCVDDHAYMAFRDQVRATEWRNAFLAKSLDERRAIVRALRAESREATGAKAESIMDVNAEAVAETMRAHGVHQLIHGHTHRPGQHTLELDGAPARRIVLGDWYDRGSILCCTPNGCELQTLEPGA